jgi:hypothetical protein
VLLTVILIVALVVITVLIYQGDSPLLRSGLGVALLAVVVWTSTQLPRAERASWTTPEGPRRRFHQLRSQTVQLLAEIRRLNGIAEDEKRGFRDQRTAELEMETIEARMRELLSGIRAAAGVASPADEGNMSQAPSSAEAP